MTFTERPMSNSYRLQMEKRASKFYQLGRDGLSFPNESQKVYLTKFGLWLFDNFPIRLHIRMDCMNGNRPDCWGFRVRFFGLRFQYNRKFRKPISYKEVPVYNLDNFVLKDWCIDVPEIKHSQEFSDFLRDRHKDAALKDPAFVARQIIADRFQQNRDKYPVRPQPKRLTHDDERT